MTSTGRVTLHRGMASVIKVRTGDPTTDMDLSRIADYRVVGTGKGLLAPVSPTQVALVRAPKDRAAVESLFETQKGFWQSQHAQSRAQEVGPSVTNALAEKLGKPLISLLGNTMGFFIDGDEAPHEIVMVKDSPLIIQLLGQDAPHRAATRGLLSSWKIDLVDTINRQFGLQLLNMGQAQALLQQGKRAESFLKEDCLPDFLAAFIVKEGNSFHSFAQDGTSNRLDWTVGSWFSGGLLLIK